MIFSQIQTTLSEADLTQCQRLFHGRGHAFKGFEHVNVDLFSPVILITVYQEVEEPWLTEFAGQLSEAVAECKSVQVQYRCRSKAPIEVLVGGEVTETVVTENGEQFHIQLGKSQNVGLFLDMANGRRWLKQQAKDKNILNLFAYTCGFSISAIAGDAKQVINIDMAKASLAKGRENHKLNYHDLSKVKFEGVDIFKSYGRLKKYGPYDIVICDPPSFQKGSVNIERDYKKIIKRIPQLVESGAEIILCLNSPDLDEQFLLDEVARECPDCQFIERINNPAVFIEAEQGKGLKVLRFQYLP